MHRSISSPKGLLLMFSLASDRSNQNTMHGLMLNLFLFRLLPGVCHLEHVCTYIFVSHSPCLNASKLSMQACCKPQVHPHSSCHASLTPCLLSIPLQKSPPTDLRYVVQGISKSGFSFLIRFHSSFVTSDR